MLSGAYKFSVLNVVMLNLIMLSAVMLSVIMQSVAHPKHLAYFAVAQWCFSGFHLNQEKKVLTENFEVWACVCEVEVRL
jgi:hypothetical protein